MLKVFGFKSPQANALISLERWNTLPAEQKLEMLNAKIVQRGTHKIWTGQINEYGIPVVAEHLPAIAEIRRLNNDDFPMEGVMDIGCGEPQCVEESHYRREYRRALSSEITVTRPISALDTDTPIDNDFEIMEKEFMQESPFCEFPPETLSAVGGDIDILRKLSKLGMIKAPEPPESVTLCVYHGAWMSSATCALSKSGPCESRVYKLQPVSG